MTHFKQKFLRATILTQKSYFDTKQQFRHNFFILPQTAISKPNIKINNNNNKFFDTKW